LAERLDQRLFLRLVLLVPDRLDVGRHRLGDIFGSRSAIRVSAALDLAAFLAGTLGEELAALADFLIAWSKGW
jgi:hypothetical protein